jgi:beta-galactosidase
MYTYLHTRAHTHTHTSNQFDPEHGRAVSESSMRRDICLLKQLNFNAVRGAHYPNHPRWLELCDEAGLYVVDEANIETHGFQSLGQPIGYLSHQKEWASALCTRSVSVSVSVSVAGSCYQR